MSPAQEHSRASPTPCDTTSPRAHQCGEPWDATVTRTPHSQSPSFSCHRPQTTSEALSLRCHGTRANHSPAPCDVTGIRAQHTQPHIFCYHRHLITSEPFSFLCDSRVHNIPAPCDISGTRAHCEATGIRAHHSQPCPLLSHRYICTSQPALLLVMSQAPEYLKTMFLCDIKGSRVLDNPVIMMSQTLEYITAPLLVMSQAPEYITILFLVTRTRIYHIQLYPF